MSAAFRRNKKNFECLTCNKKFASKTSLKNHKRIHRKNVLCKFCLKSFRDKTNLFRHVRIHKGEKPYVCFTCDKKFATKYQLQDHQATHSEERNFKCMVCPDNRSFKTKDQLTTHMFFHYEKQFACKQCGKKYYTSAHLKRHIKTHLC